MKLGKKVTIFDSETGEVIKNAVSFGSQNGEGWFIMYRESLANLAINAPGSVVKVFSLLASKQEFENGINTTKKAISEELKMSYQHIWEAFKWLKENSYIKERKVNGQTQFLLNPNVTTQSQN